jgi:5-methylcytosine-specific restriction endonuclease McrA
MTTLKECKRCGEKHPDTREYFVFNSRTQKPTQPCKRCAREQKRTARAKAQGKPLVNRDAPGGFVACVICGEVLVQMTGSHTKKHGLTFAEYQQQFPDAPTMSTDLRMVMRDNATEGWSKHYDELVQVRRDVGQRIRGEKHHSWKGGYEPGGELYAAGLGAGDAKFRARRQNIRVHGHKCMIPGCDFDYVVHNHHIIPRREGGAHTLDNCILLCPNHHALADADVLTREYLSSVVRDALTTKGLSDE